MIEINRSDRAPSSLWPLPPEPAREVPLRRLVLVTDAWKPQTNGVVNTLVRLVDDLESRGTEVRVIAPDAHLTLPLPSYPEIRVACDPWRAIPRIQAFAPDAIHRHGGRSASGRRMARRAGAALHQLPPATRVPERAPPVPLEGAPAGELVPRARDPHLVVTGRSAGLQERSVGGRRCTGSAGSTRPCSTPTAPPRPVRAAPDDCSSRPRRREKTLEDFLASARGTRGVATALRGRSGARFPASCARFRFARIWRPLPSADCFVFPSRTDLRQRDAGGDGLRAPWRRAAPARRPGEAGATAPRRQLCRFLRGRLLAREARASMSAPLRLATSLRANLVPLAPGPPRFSPRRRRSCPGRGAAL